MKFRDKKPKLSLRIRIGILITIVLLVCFVTVSGFHTLHAPSHLARLTAYWPNETQGDAYTALCKSSTGITLHEGHCAVDPHIIPYGSIVNIEGVGKFLAVDTGSAVVGRHAARKWGRTPIQRNALVIDIYLPSQKAAKNFIRNHAEFAMITWSRPPEITSEDRKLFPDKDWARLEKF